MALDPVTRAQFEYEFTERMRAAGVPILKDVPYLPGPEWAQKYFPQWFTRPFTQYQLDFWKWVDAIQPATYARPRIECEPRGVGKSTNAEAAVCKLLAERKRKMVGYVSLNDTKATKHFENVKSMLESPLLLEDYPHCLPKIQKLRDVAAQWSRDALVTDSDAMVVPLTLLGSSRGWKSSTGSRFDMIVLDDIDELGQSPEFTAKLIELLKGEILAAGDNTTIVLMPQNLIYRDSICSQIQDHRADILSDRIFCGPYPLLEWYDAEKVDIPGDDTGAKQWIITNGQAFDPAIDLNYAQNLLNSFGKATFDRECQQEVTKIEDDKDFREWNEIYHIITESEFRAVMEEHGEAVWNEKRQRLQIPPRWNVGLGFDWGTTKNHPSAVAFVARPPQLSAFRDYHFVFAELIKPEFPLDAFEDPELVSPGRVAYAIQDILDMANVAETQVQMRLLSHEASAALATMAVDLKDDIKQFFTKWQAKKGSGVPQIQNSLEIDYTLPHLFRKYPDGAILDGQNVSGGPVSGSPRIFFIVADGQGELKCDHAGRLYVVGPKDRHGFARARFEMPIYSHRNSASKKIDDDFVDAFRGLMNVFGVSSSPPTKIERFEKQMSEKGLDREEIMQIESEADKLARLQVRLIEERAFAKKQKPVKYRRVGVRRPL